MMENDYLWYLIGIISSLPGSGLNDGQWHSVQFLALESAAILTINGDETSSVRATLPIQIRTVGDYYFGGLFSFYITVCFYIFL